jgi:hypothetical protein
MGALASGFWRACRAFAMSRLWRSSARLNRRAMLAAAPTAQGTPSSALTPRSVPDDSDLALADITLASAKDQLFFECTAADVIDLKAVGLATADVAALTILVAAHRTIGFWWVPAAFMVMGGVCFFLVLWQRDWEFGPRLNEFREKYAGLSRTEILEGMLSDVEDNRKHNDPFLESKADWFLRGYFALALGFSGLVAVGFRVLV